MSGCPVFSRFQFFCYQRTSGRVYGFFNWRVSKFIQLSVDFCFFSFELCFSRLQIRIQVFRIRQVLFDSTSWLNSDTRWSFGYFHGQGFFLVGHSIKFTSLIVSKRLIISILFGFVASSDLSQLSIIGFFRRSIVRINFRIFGFNGFFSRFIVSLCFLVLGCNVFDFLVIDFESGLIIRFDFRSIRSCSCNRYSIFLFNTCFFSFILFC